MKGDKRFSYVGYDAICERRCADDDKKKPRLGIHKSLLELTLRPPVGFEASLACLSSLLGIASLLWLEKPSHLGRVW